MVSSPKFVDMVPQYKRYAIVQRKKLSSTCKFGANLHSTHSCIPYNCQMNGIWLAIQSGMEYDNVKRNKENLYGKDYKFYH